MIQEDIYDPCPCYPKGSVDRAWVGWLAREWTAINEYYRLNLTRPLFALGDYKGKHGEWNPISRTITMNRSTIRKYPWHVIVDILKHEMAHQTVSECSPYDTTPHGIHFRLACERMGLPDWAMSATGDLPAEIPNWRKTSLNETEERLLDRTNKLLALAQSDNEHEASLAMQKVRELYAKYNLDEFERRKESSFVSWFINYRRKRIENWQSIVLVILDKHFFVRTISFREYDAKDLTDYCAAEIIGKKQNVMMAEYVYTFLEKTVHSLWEKHLSENPSLQFVPHPRLRSERRHFLIGVLDGFMKHLDETNGFQGLDRTERDCIGLIKAADMELDSHFRRKYPRTSIRSSSGFNPDRESYRSGVNEGQKIRIHKPVSDNKGYRGNLLMR